MRLPGLPMLRFQKTEYLQLPQATKKSDPTWMTNGRRNNHFSGLAFCIGLMVALFVCSLLAASVSADESRQANVITMKQHPTAP